MCETSKGNKLRGFLATNGLTQKDLAKVLSTTPQSISYKMNFEKFTQSDITKLLEFFSNYNSDIKYEDLFM